MEPNPRFKTFETPFNHTSFKDSHTTSLLELRRSKRESQIQKHRNLNEPPDWIKLNTHYPETYSESDLPEILSNLSIRDDTSYLYVAQAVRKLLCTSESTNTKIVTSEIIKLIPRWLQRNDFSQLQYETAWICTNISSSSHCQILDKIGALPLIVNLLKSQCPEVRCQAAWVISNVAANSPEERNKLVALKSIEVLVECLSSMVGKKKEQGTFVWAICNLLRTKPFLEYQKVRKVLKVLYLVLFSEELTQVVDVCWGINVYVGELEVIQMLTQSEYLARLFDLCVCGNDKVVIIVLKLFGGIFYQSSVASKVCLDAGFSQILENCLANKHGEVLKNTIWVIANISAERSNQLRYLFQNRIFETLFQLAETGSAQIKIECSWAICNACTSSTFEETVKLVELGVIQVLTYFLRNDITPSICLEALYQVLFQGQELLDTNNQNPFIVALEECGGVDLVEKFALVQENLKISSKAERILTLINGPEPNHDICMNLEEPSCKNQ